MRQIKDDNDFYIFECPNCDEEIIVNKTELNCRIFRHAIYKHNYEQVNPHLPKESCETLIKEDKVYGCCKPFEVIDMNGKLYVTICEYK